MERVDRQSMKQALMRLRAIMYRGEYYRAFDGREGIELYSICPRHGWQWIYTYDRGHWDTVVGSIITMRDDYIDTIKEDYPTEWESRLAMEQAEHEEEYNKVNTLAIFGQL